MSRRHRAERRKVLPDPKFADETLTRFINNVMTDGKKSTAERIVYGALAELDKKPLPTNQNVDEATAVKSRGLALFHVALSKVAPRLEVRSRRVGGATYQVPMEVRGSRGVRKAMEWIIAAARKRAEKKMRLRLAAEIHEAANDRGAAIKKKDDTHKMAEANKAFAHYRWR
ncbi:MAG TPA: 30S ribosomal protein S7 [Rhodospirillaceae bacterium]|jgi:small subunit ribosomal protein S7|nr:30S ribosomal protein S7 [Alphaproteobacteria bacterium]HBH26496.1 30S ribosomal protein S7 [Rhodospirillaceae bacterium]